MTGEHPGGPERHFCKPELTASRHHLSTLEGHTSQGRCRININHCTSLAAQWADLIQWLGQDLVAKAMIVTRLDRRFEPEMADADREALYAGWQDAVNRTRSNAFA